MKKIISYIIAIMMTVTMMPYTAFAGTASGNDISGIENAIDDEKNVNIDITIGQPEEITVYYYENKEVTVESEDTSIAYGMVTNTSMIISSGSVLYGSTIKITPSQIGTVDLIIKANGKADKTYTVNVKPVKVDANLHIGESSAFEFVSLYDEVITFRETEGLIFNVLSKTQRTSTMVVNGIAVKEINYVYKIQVDYSQPGMYSYTFWGDKSGEVFEVTAAVSDHDWEDEPTVDKEPTCVDEGLSATHCKDCDAVKDEISIPVLEHTYDWVVDQAATEEMPGIKHEECIICGEVRNEGTVIEQLTHTHDLEVTEAAAPTCTTGGNIKYFTCTACGNIYEDEDAVEQLTHKDTLIAPIGHKVSIRSAVPATCTEDGMTEEAYCSVCDEILVPHKIVLASGHRYSSEWNSDRDYHWYQCECGLRSGETEHNFEWVIDKEATEEESGIKHEECTECHFIRNKNTNIDKLLHTHELVRIAEKQPTCTAEGNIEYFICRSCNNIYSDENTQHLINMSGTVQNAKGHNYSEWMTISKSSCVRKGYEFTSCKECGIAEIRELPLRPHKYEHIKVEPTCTVAGADITKCSSCDMQVMEEIPATGHVERAIEIAPTCTEEGKTGGIECSKCGEIIKAPKSLPMKWHTYGEWITEKTATCTEPGHEYRVCRVCKFVDTAVIARLEHTVEVIPAVEATCTKTGLTEGICCTSCNQILKEQNTINKTAHKWSDRYTVDKRASIKSNGTMTRHCIDCSESNKNSMIKIYMIKKATVESLVYNGSTRTPKVTVTGSNGKKLIKGTDYTVVYKNAAGTKTVKPANVGTYKALITFKGKYRGSVTRTFKISPKATSITKITKPAKKQLKVYWQKRTDQVTGYQIRYSLKQNMSGAKTITVTKASTSSRIIKKMTSKKKYWLQIRTYKTVNGQKYYSAWSAKKVKIVK